MRFSNMFIVMLANSADRDAYEMTAQAISSVNASRPKNSIFTLIETNVNLLDADFYKEPYKVDRFFTKAPFNFNQALALAVKDFAMLPTDIFCVLNNDIIIHGGAFDALIDALARWDVVSMWTDNSVLQKEHRGELEGYNPSHFFSGWAWACSWAMIAEIGFEQCFPPELKFWYQDNWFIEQFRARRKKHALIRAAVVTHWESRSHRLLENVEDATIGQRAVFERLKETHR